MDKLKQYMGFNGDAGSQDGACLIFAHNVKEAKVVGFPTVNGWFDTEWTSMRVRLLKDHNEYLLQEADPEKYAQGLPHVIDAPKTCPTCYLWGGGPVEDGGCDYCREDDE